MSSRRKPDTERAKYKEYLRSPAWRHRSAEWRHDEQARTGRRPECAACLINGSLELHHLDYSGVTWTSDGWVAEEDHDDIVALCPRCHEAVHKLLDFESTYGGLSRRIASLEAIRRLRRRIVNLVLGQTPELMEAFG